MENTEDDIKVEEEIIEKKPYDFSSPWHFSDVVLVVEDSRFHVHKSTLSMWSPVFEKMFTSGFSERNAEEIPLPGKRASEVEVLLKVIYSSGTKQEVNDENHLFLMELAEEYQMEKVKELCANWLMKQKIHIFNCIRRYNLAERFGLEDLKSKCVEFASYLSYDRLEAVKGYKEMTPEVKLDICIKRIEELEKTLTDYVAICSEHVACVYRAIAFNTLKDECGRKEEHSYEYGRERKRFDLSCECCMRRVKNVYCQVSSGLLTTASKKLYDLERQNKVLELKKGARFREAKKKV